MPRQSTSRSHTPEKQRRSEAPSSSPQPARKKRSRDEDEDEVEEIVDDDGDEDEDGSDEDEYEVERIEKAQFDKSTGSYMYYVKWKGYAESENTWEPEANIIATDLINDYWENQPRSNQKHKKEAYLKQQQEEQSKKKDKRRANHHDEDSDSDAGDARRGKSTSAPPRSSKQKQKQKSSRSDDQMDVDDPTQEEPTDDEIERLKKVVKQKYDALDDWEDKVDRITTLERHPDGEVVVYILFTCGLEIPCPLPTVNQKCPQHMLKFYESRLRFFNNKNTEEVSGSTSKSPSTSKGKASKGRHSRAAY